MNENGGYRERNSSADKALDILLLFDESRPVLAGAQVAEILGVGRSTAYRYLQSLVSCQLLEATGGTGFRLGVRVLELARLASHGLNLLDLARPVMRRLADEVGESAVLARRSGQFVVCLAIEDADQPVRTALSPGDLLPANAGAPALVLLAWAPADEVERVIGAGVQRFTEATMTDAATLRARLSVIRAHGFAISRGEFLPGLLGISAPVRDASGHVTAALAVVAPGRRVPDERVPGIVTLVQAAAAEITDHVELLS